MTSVENWANTIQFRSPAKMIELYADKAILIPTFDKILQVKKLIKNYFVEFLNKNGLTCKIEKNQSIPLGNGFHTCNGYYKFEFLDDSGVNTTVLARYTYIFNKSGKIIVHHSSEQPT